MMEHPSNQNTFTDNHKIDLSSLEFGTSTPSASSPHKSAQIHQTQENTKKHGSLLRWTTRKSKITTDSNQEGNHQLSNTPADIAFVALTNQFGKAADKKLNAALKYEGDRDRYLADILGPGADPTFDKLLCAIGSIARHRPKDIIDAIFFWVESKKEEPSIPIARQLTDIGAHLRGKESNSFSRERKQLAVTYISRRALIQVVKRLQVDSLPDDYGDKLEERLFAEMRNSNPDMSRSPDYKANLDLLAKLIGWVSNIRFASVSDRFISILEKHTRGTVLKERDSKVEMVIKIMRHLKLRIYPIEALEETAEFLQSCATFFRSTHAIRIKRAYSTLFVHVLMPIAAVATAEVNLPAWLKTVDLIYQKAWKMAIKPRNSDVGLV
ncbi:uncharacterized protein VTP21DRAFT_10311 [Calcarisporiella thermophila]|uniref:uncharacterized protein n=1 Tax=Calcarisporiella thermophila TaxID=911321 RepID=UPI0037438415